MTTLIQLAKPDGRDVAYREIQLTLANAGLPARTGFTFDPKSGHCGAFVSDNPQVIAAFVKVTDGTADEDIVRDASDVGE